MKKRAFAMTLMVATLAGMLWLDLDVLHGSLMLHIILLVCTYFGLVEFWQLCRATGHQTFSIWGTWCGCMMVVAHYFAMYLLTEPGTLRSAQIAYHLFNGALTFSILGTFFLTAQRKNLDASLGGVAVTCLGLLYVPYLMSYIVKIRHINIHGTLGGRIEDWNLFGHKMVIATIALAKGCDVWAYLFGRAFGRHRPFPVLSPGKTVEGLIAGVLGSVALALVMNLSSVGILTAMTTPKAALFGFIIAISGILGDLMESLLKRSAGAKDAGQVVPGYGGVLDVIDSLMVAGPVAYYLIPVML
jgi:phosphatidate cytidylyltransferase